MSIESRHQNHRRHVLALAAAAALGPLSATPAAAAVCTWDATNGNWSAIANWLDCVTGNGNPAQTPGSNDTANIGGTGVVTIDSAQSVQNLNNAGRINLDAFTLTLGGGGGTVNSGIINVGSATAAALQVSTGHNINNAGGVVNVANGSVLNQFGSTISGGTINTTGSGKLVGYNSGNNFLDGLTLNGTLDLASATGIERVTGGLTLNGSVNIGSGSVLAPQGDQTIGGNGSIVFADNNSGNRFNTEAGNLVLASGITVRGNTGVIGGQNFVGGAATLTNKGTIQADVSGGTITIAVNNPVTNYGTLAARNGGTLVLNSNIDSRTGSQILADAGSTVLQNGVALNGDIKVVGAGAFIAVNSGNNFLNGASFTGTLDLASATGIERVTGGLTLNGSVNIGSGSVLAPQGDQTIGGNGSIVFADNNSGNRFNTEAGNLVLASGITVRGDTGVIGGQNFVGGAATLTNKGTIQADVSGGTITIAVNNPVTNYGTLAARNGGTLVLNSNIDSRTGSQILADAGSTVLQNGVALNGDIKVVGAGAFIAVNSGNNFLNGASFTGTLYLASATGIERVAGGLTLNGSVNIGKGSVLAPQGDQTIGGNGSIVFADNNSGNRFNTEAGNLVLASGITVRGDTGVIGGQNFVGGAATLTNNGTIQADVSGGTITIAVNNPVTNYGTLAARNGGTLVLNSNIDSRTGSQILADAGSTVLQNGVALNGDIKVVGAGAFIAVNSGNNFLNGASFTGTLDLASATGIERVAGGLTLNGSVNIGSGSVLAPQGDQTIGGNGSIVFADNNGGNRFNTEAGNLVLASGITVRGNTGVIGGQNFVGGAATLTNKGTIQADVAGGTITLAVNGGVINDGTMRAQDGTLTLSSALVNNGTLRADAAGIMNLPTNFANAGLMTGVGKFALSGTLANNGHMRPGTPGSEPGALTLDGSYAQGADGWFDVGLDDANFGSLAVSGSAMLNGTIGVICEGACDYAVGTSWIVMMSGGANLVTGTFVGPVAMTGFSDGAFSVTYLPNQVILNVTEATVGVVPEPGTVALMLAGLAAVGFVAKRRRQA